MSSLNIFDLDQYFNTRLPRDHVKKDSDYFASHSLWNLIKHKRILKVVEKILGPEILSNPVQNTRIKQPEKTLPKNSIFDASNSAEQSNAKDIDGASKMKFLLSDLFFKRDIFLQALMFDASQPRPQTPSVG